VTSDIFDLETIARWRKVEWRECLLGGVGIYGTRWPGHQAVARFMFEAASFCGVLGEMKYAGYNVVGERRTRSIKPESFPRLLRSELKGAVNATGVLFVGEHPAPGIEGSFAYVGGEANGSRRVVRTLHGPKPAEGEPYYPLRADFIFPLTNDPADTASELFRMAAELLDAEYGYYFVRDELCFPGGYVGGFSAPLDYKALEDRDAAEIGGWADFVRGPLWTGPWPKLRDLYEVNLLSERHTARPVEGLGYLAEWIEARPGRGRLTDIGKGRLLWTLTDAELFNTRPLLNEAGLLVSCYERVYRNLQVKPSA